MQEGEDIEKESKNGRLGTETTNPQVATVATHPPTNAAHATYVVDVAESHTVDCHAAAVAAVAPFAPSYTAIEAAADTDPFLRHHRQDPIIHDFHSLCHRNTEVGQNGFIRAKR